MQRRSVFSALAGLLTGGLFRSRVQAAATIYPSNIEERLAKCEAFVDAELDWRAEAQRKAAEVERRVEAGEDKLDAANAVYFGY